jgi:hypothetical protein
MVEQFSWILVSDIHLRNTQDTWAQSVVLKDLVSSVTERFGDGNGPSFMIVSGDLAFAGQPDEYQLVVPFLDALAAPLKLNRRLVFPVSGNHDANRKAQTTCFAGARHVLTSPQKVDEFLGVDEERLTILKRLSGYQAFDATYCAGQARETTADGLAYVAPLQIDGMPICVVGLQSSWMCGGDDDQNNLLVGDRPVINALSLLPKHDPRLVLGVMHHPSFWLREFDQQSIEDRFYPACDVIHRGHLHEPGAKLVSNVPGQSCVIVAAGAGYAGRLWKNSYSYVTAEISRGTVRVETFVYDPTTNRFNPRDDVRHPLRLRGKLPGTGAVLAGEIASIAEVAPFANYVAALISGVVNEVPIRIGGEIVFAAATFLGNSEDAEMTSSVRGIFEVANLLLTFREAVPLLERVQQVSERIRRFGVMLRQAATDAGFAVELGHREENCRTLLTPASATPFAMTAAYLKELADAGEWVQLEEAARQHVGSGSRPLSLMARRFLVLALAKQGDAAKATEACNLACDIVSAAGCEVPDFVQATTLLYNEKRYADSGRLIVEFAGLYGAQLHLVRDVGLQVYQHTKDAALGAALGIKKGKK